MRKKILLTISFVLIFLSIFGRSTNLVNAEPLTRNEGLNISTSSGSCTIEQEAFRRSVPYKAIIGQTFRAIIIITNTGEESSKFYVDLFYPYKYAIRYFYSSWKGIEVILEPGVTQRIEFDITPLSEYIGETKIEARAYSSIAYLSNPELEPIDKVSASVYEIKNVLSNNFLLVMMGIPFLIILFFIGIKSINNPSIRKDFFISIVLFTVSFLLRIFLVFRTSIHADEGFFWIWSYYLLNKKWVWTLEHMMNHYPPLFFYLLASLISLFGNNLLTIRMISIISGSLSVVVLYFFAKSLFDRRVGLFSALLLCFASYHILYSTTATTESTMILLIVLSAYFFWISRQQNNLKYFGLSGFLLGIAYNIKYIAIIVFPFIILFELWIGKKIKILFDKKILIYCASFIITIIPVNYVLLINNQNPLISYLKITFGPKVFYEQTYFQLFEYIPRGFRMFIYYLARTASPWLPWLKIYEASIFLLIIVLIFYYLNAMKKAHSNETFLLFLMVAMLLILVDPLKHAKWLLYNAPFFFTMVSNVIIRYSDDIKARISGSVKLVNIDLFKIITILFSIIFVFSNVLVGSVAPFIEEGEFAAFRSGMLFVKNRINPNDVVAGYHIETYFHYFDKYDIPGIFVSLVKKPDVDKFLFKGSMFMINPQLNVDLLLELKPRFILEGRQFFNYYYNNTVKEWVLENYELVFTSRPYLGYSVDITEYQECLVFERKTV